MANGETVYKGLIQNFKLGGATDACKKILVTVYLAEDVFEQVRLCLYSRTIDYNTLSPSC